MQSYEWNQTINKMQLNGGAENAKKIYKILLAARVK